MRRASTATGALLALAGTALLTVWSLTGLVDQAAAPGQASLDTLLGLVAGVGAAGCGVWLAAGAVLTVLGSLPGALVRNHRWRRAWRLERLPYVVGKRGIGMAPPISGVGVWIVRY